MSYVAQVLQPGERVRAVGHLHWVIFWRAILLAAIGFAVLALAPEFAR
jgi:hypothetical protein